LLGHERDRIKQMLLTGFLRCLYPLQKFDSDTERRFSIILDSMTQLQPTYNPQRMPMSR
jgi:type III restriction enzyme